MVKNAGFARFAWNWALAEYKSHLELTPAERPELGKHEYALNRRFNAVKLEIAPWSKELNQGAGMLAIQALGQTIRNFWNCRNKQPLVRGGKVCPSGCKRHRFPRFKSKDRARIAYQSECDKNEICIEGRKIRLRKIGWVKMREALRFDGVCKEVTVCKDGKRWYACIAVEMDDMPPAERNEPVIGIDMGIKTLATLSDGSTVENPRALERYARKLRRVDKAIARSRTQHGANQSSNRRGALYAERQRLHARIHNIRNDAQHKGSTAIVKKAGTVKVETLNVSGMLRNRRLAKALSDAAMSNFLGQLEYKSGWNGVHLEKIDRWYPSTKTCSNCGTIRPVVTLGERVFNCSDCGYSEDRDLNAAINIEKYDADN